MKQIFLAVWRIIVEHALQEPKFWLFVFMLIAANNISTDDPWLDIKSAAIAVIVMMVVAIFKK